MGTVFFSRFIGRVTTRARRQILATNSLAKIRRKKYFVHFIYVSWQRRCHRELVPPPHFGTPPGTKSLVF